MVTGVQTCALPISFDESRLASERFGAVLSGEQVAALNKVDDAADRLGVALDGMKLQLSATFAPAVASSINTITEAIGGMTRSTIDSTDSLKSFFEEFKRNHPIIASALLGPVSGRAAPTPVFPPAVTGPQQDAQVGEFALQQGREQEALGLRIRDQLIEKFGLLKAAGHAQEALGRVTLAIIQRETSERNNEFASMVEEQDRVRMLNLELSKPPTTGPFVEAIAHKEEAVRNLLNIMPELTREEALLNTVSQEDKGAAIVQASVEAWIHRNDEIGRAHV